MSPHQHDPSSTSSPLVAVTGATGRIGGAVAAQLRAGGLAPRLVVRNASRAPEWADAVLGVAQAADIPAWVLGGVHEAQSYGPRGRLVAGTKGVDGGAVDVFGSYRTA